MRYFWKGKEEMKKLLTFLAIAFLAMQLSIAKAATVTVWTSGPSVTKVNTIGKNLLTKNGLPNNIKFVVQESDDVNAFANVDGEVWVFTGLLKFVTNDNELAAVIAHEIGHIVNHHVTRQNTINTVGATALANSGLSSNAQKWADTAATVGMLKMSRTDEYEADITGTDLMIKAGYNPLGMVSMLNSLNAGGTTSDFLSTHPAGDKRTMNVWNYLSYTYPAKTKVAYNNESYKKFSEYAKPIVDARNADSKKLAKFNKEQKKLQDKRIAKMEKYQKANGTSAWDKSFNAIQTINSLKNITN